MRSWFARLVALVVSIAGSPWAFLAALSSVALWLAMGPMLGFSDTWQLYANTATTLVTFLMVFVLQHATNRSEAAVHTKLDGIIAAIERADNRLIGIEKREEDA